MNSRTRGDTGQVIKRYPASERPMGTMTAGFTARISTKREVIHPSISALAGFMFSNVEILTTAKCIENNRLLRFYLMPNLT